MTETEEFLTGYEDTKKTTLKFVKNDNVLIWGMW
jgi:hypothetical protein